MSKTMLIDAAHAEETRVAIVDGRQIEEFDFESKTKRQLRGNIYLAKVTRVEPSLQAAFVEYGGNRHGFLAFNEIHPDYYQIPAADREAIMAEAPGEEDDHDEPIRESDDGESEGGLAEEERLKRRLMRRYKIQDVIKRRQILLVQVVKDERGSKGAALTTWLSLAGRYCVLMPNTGKGGGISRKITQATDRKRLKAAAAALDVPRGMGLIIRTAGAKRTKIEIKRDYDYLLRLWETIRETTLASHAPSMIYEEENLVRRAVRDMFDKDFDGIQVEGVEGFREARDFMRVLMPSQSKKVHLYQGSKPLFAANGIEELLTQIHQPVVPLKSGGYLVINQTEALVAIDVNSGKATKERNVEATAFKTNSEAAVEAARQLRLRDLAGLVVIDFIDMDESRNNRTVEKILKDSLAQDRARIQMGKISGFGLMEISRQRRRLGVLEGATEVCPHCQGAGRVRSAESAALMTLRAVDIEAGKGGAGSITLKVSGDVALYILNHKRAYLQRLEDQRGLHVILMIDNALAQGDCTIERTETNEDFVPVDPATALPDLNDDFDDSAYDDSDDFDDDVGDDDHIDDDDDENDPESVENRSSDSGTSQRRGRSRNQGGHKSSDTNSETPTSPISFVEGDEQDDDDDSDGGRRRRRGRRGGRRVREDGDSGSSFFWVRGRTPSLNDPFVWFDPINPQASKPEKKDSDDAQPSPAAGNRDASTESSRSSRRRRGRSRGGGGAATSSIVAQEARATAEGMPPEGSPETPMATVQTETGAMEPVVIAEPAKEPQRRRVRRKPSTAVPTTAGVDEANTHSGVIAPVVTKSVATPDVVTVEATAPAETAPMGETHDEPEAPDEPVSMVDVADMIANDPAQIATPPEKPKRGWWRR